MVTQKFLIKIDPQSLVPNDAVRQYYWWSMGIVVAMTGAIVLIWQYLPQVVPFFFTEPWGEARLAPKLYLFLLPLIELVVTVVNVIIGKAIPSDHRVLNYALGVGSLVVGCMLSLSLYGIAQSLL